MAEGRVLDRPRCQRYGTEERQRDQRETGKFAEPAADDVAEVI